MIPARRGTTEDEAAVIHATLERAPVRPIDETTRVTVARLTVIARCECGCASVDFDSPASVQRSTPITDGAGTTPRGGQVGVIVWGRSDAMTGIEIDDLGAGDDDLMLPVATSVVPATLGGWHE
jgi:hypothetical protein